MSCYAVILSGGIGTRMGCEIPKQYVCVCGKPIINYSLKNFIINKRIRGIVIVVSDNWKQYVKSGLEKLNIAKPVYFAPSGKTRQFSIFNALNLLKDIGAQDMDNVIIHDAARPLVSEQLINKCLDNCSNCDGVLPVLGVKDTIYVSYDRLRIDELIDRNSLFAGQAPECFTFGKYFSAHIQIEEKELLKINGSTEIAYKSGMNIHLIDGDPMNFKITTPEDLVNFQNIIERVHL